MGGPYVKEVGSFTGANYSKRTWRTQAKPYVKPLEFEFWSQSRISGTNAGNNYQPVLNPSSPNSTLNVAVAKALQRFRESLGEAAGAAINAVQYAQSRDMVVRRATQLVKAAKQVRRGQFGKAARTLGVTQPKGATRKKQFADNWLEFTFGWVPAVKDIFSACKAFVRDIPAGRATGKATATWSETFGYYPPNPNGPPGRSGGKSSYTERILVAAKVYVTNSDLWLANQLGLLNPASVAWDAVPFSFVVDWFFDIGSFLESLTCMVGLEIRDGFQTRSTLCSRQYWSLDVAYEPPWKPIFRQHSGVGYIQRRTLGVPAYPAPSLRAPSLSVGRAVTAISLLVQQLKIK